MVLSLVFIRSQIEDALIVASTSCIVFVKGITLLLSQELDDN